MNSIETLKLKGARLSKPSTTQWPFSVPGRDLPEEHEICEHFLQNVRHVPNSRENIRILSSIQFTADFLEYSDAHVARVLVDLGLRAPRMAFPADFLRFADDCLMRSGWEIGGPSLALQELRDFWDRIGEDKFVALRRDYSLARAATFSL